VKACADGDFGWHLFIARLGDKDNKKVVHVKPIIAGAGTSPEANKRLYDEWAQQYTKDVRDWGYNMPEKMAECVKAKVLGGKDAATDFKALDAGAGDGLSGQALRSELGGLKNAHITGVDLSPELIDNSRERGIYSACDVVDLSKPMTMYTDNAFDLLTLVGVMTYLEPEGCSVPEMVRVVKKGGVIAFTHRTDKVAAWRPLQEKLVKDRKWELLHETAAMPYLPNNKEYGDKILVAIHMFRVL